MRTVTTVEELDALPEHTVIRSESGWCLVAYDGKPVREWWVVGKNEFEVGSEALAESELFGGDPTFEVLAMPVSELCAIAWEEGAQAGWASSCEGNNGEFTHEFGTHDGKALFRDVAPEYPNPYRDGTGEVDV